MTEAPQTFLFVVLVIPVTLLAIGWLSARLSGWTALAARYRWDDEVSGTRFGWMSIGLRPLFWYNHCLTVTVSARGLSLRMQPILRLFHPSLLIPWDRIVEVQPWSNVLTRGVALRLESDQGPVIFKRREYELLQTVFPERLRIR